MSSAQFKLDHYFSRWDSSVIIRHKDYIDIEGALCSFGEFQTQFFYIYNINEVIKQTQ